MQTITLTDIELRLLLNAITQTMDSVTGESNMLWSDSQSYIYDLTAKLRSAQTK